VFAERISRRIAGSISSGDTRRRRLAPDSSANKLCTALSRCEPDLTGVAEAVLYRLRRAALKKGAKLGGVLLVCVPIERISRQIAGSMGSMGSSLERGDQFFNKFFIGVGGVLSDQLLAQCVRRAH
jgi:hypothetical protein